MTQYIQLKPERSHNLLAVAQQRAEVHSNGVLFDSFTVYALNVSIRYNQPLDSLNGPAYAQVCMCMHTSASTGLHMCKCACVCI